ncbi:hypothetical protein TNCV_1280901 [Trichonephila clavipes]|nr:hypothetical protein TNCV_1280901 [Trichonephila clavipes]
MQDSQRTAVPSISPSLDGDDGVSDSSVSSTDSLKTRIRKLSAANRKKRNQVKNNGEFHLLQSLDLIFREILT